MNPARTRWTRAVVTAALCVTLAGIPSPVVAAEHDASLWITTLVRMPIADRYSLSLILQPRFDDDIGRIERVLIRPWFEVDIKHGFAAAVGYDMHANINPSSRWEQRAWQQLAHRHAFSGWKSLVWIRVEERFFENARAVPVRGRFLLGAIVPLPESLSLMFTNEFFVNFNTTGVVSKTGFRENRVFGTINRQFGQWTQLGVGYQMQWVDRPAQNLISHAVMLNLWFETPNVGRQKAPEAAPPTEPAASSIEERSE